MKREIPGVESGLNQLQNVVVILIFLVLSLMIVTESNVVFALYALPNQIFS